MRLTLRCSFFCGTPNADSFIPIAADVAGDELDSYGHFELLQPLPAKALDCAPRLGLVVRRTQLNVSADDSTSEGMLLSVDDGIFNKFAFQENVFHFGWKDLLTAHVDHFRFAAHESEIVALHLHTVTGNEVSILGERARGIEIAQHRRIGLDLQNSIHHTEVVP